MQLSDMRVGQKVLIDRAEDDHSEPGWARAMDEYNGKLVTVSVINTANQYFYLIEDDRRWFWCARWAIFVPGRNREII